MRYTKARCCAGGSSTTALEAELGERYASFEERYGSGFAAGMTEL